MKVLLEDPLMPLHYCDGGDPGQSLAGVVGRGKWSVTASYLCCSHGGGVGALGA